jgi:hypothetical protein
MGSRKATRRTSAKARASVKDLPSKKTKNVKGGSRSMGTASGFIPGAGAISASITK